MKKNEVTVKCKQEVDAVGSMLSDLANNFKEGKVVIQKGTSFVTLRPAGQIEVEVEAVEKKGKQKIEIQLSWKEEILLDDPEAEIKISAEEPVLDVATPIEGQIEDESEPKTDC
ncbi:MAG: amphi-Trp domain-containing protein [Deltaproteobacteria bacterium]|nr:amphi-Trp domain-containing protein [Deltaproteobacteria bacterium]